MKDSKSILEMKKSALASSGTNTSSDGAVTKEGGFKLYHLLICFVLGLLLGAYAQVTLSK